MLLVEQFSSGVLLSFSLSSNLPQVVEVGLPLMCRAWEDLQMEVVEGEGDLQKVEEAVEGDLQRVEVVEEEGSFLVFQEVVEVPKMDQTSEEQTHPHPQSL